MGKQQQDPTPKLKRFDKTNTHGGGGKVATRSLTVMENGGIRLSRLLAEAMGVVEGNGVALLQDEASPRDWYLVRDDDNGFNLRTEGSNGHLRISAASVGRDLLKSIEWEERYANMLVGDVQQMEKMDVWPVFTGSAKCTRTKKS